MRKENIRIINNPKMGKTFASGGDLPEGRRGKAKVYCGNRGKDTLNIKGKTLSL